MSQEKVIENKLSFFTQNHRLLVISMIVMFLLAGAVRLYKLQIPGLVISREYRSAIYARNFYFDHKDDIESWRREIAQITKQNQPVLEPPVTEYLISLMYRALRIEQLWFARLLTSSFWLVGGLFFFLIAKTVVPKDAAIFSTAFYLFAPLSILVSRSFQPDSLMMMLFLISLYSITSYYKKPTLLRLITSGLISGLALFTRPLVLFTIFGAFTSLAIYHRGWKNAISRQFILYMSIFLLPSILYYTYGLFISGFLQSQAEMSFVPRLLLNTEYWRGWLQLGTYAVGPTALVGALLGLSMLHKGFPRAMLIGLWFGYIVLGLVFNFHIYTHEYYHSQLIPIVSLSFAPIISLIANHLKQLPNKWYWWLPVIGAMMLVALFGIRDYRSKLGQKMVNEELAVEIGGIVNHSSKTVYVSPYYGIALQYYGELSGSFWPRSVNSLLYQGPHEQELSVVDRINALDFSPEYFVITDFSQFNRYHSDLETHLENNCSLIAKSDEYLIYGVCEP